MHKPEQTYKLENIEFRIIYSRRKTLGISVLPDASVIVRAPYRASLKTIYRIVGDKAAWIIRHRDNYRNGDQKKLNGALVTGGKQLFRGQEYELIVSRAQKHFVRINGEFIEIGVTDTNDNHQIKRLLYTIYKSEAARLFPEMVNSVLKKHEQQSFRPMGLVIRSMKSRWGSCSKKGIITLSTELIKLPDLFIEYVITHELCHLKHHNHGKEFYQLLGELFPLWKKTRKEMRNYVH
jgi:predicted metal-dependent hydrolase